MKISTTLFFTLFISISLFATEDTALGTIETFDGETISMFKHPSSRKLNLSKLPVGCDCANQKLKLFYISKEGKLEKIAEKQIKKLTLKKGAVYCKTYKQSSAVGGSTRSMAFEIPIEKDTEMRALPMNAKTKRLALQTILAKNDKYTLSTFTSDLGSSFTNICSVSTGKIVKSEKFLEIGYSKRGKTFLQTIKQYFKSCDELIAQIEQNEETNAAAKKKRHKIPYLQGVIVSDCE